MRTFYYLSLLPLLALPASAQITISGKVLDEKQQPLPFVNVLLLKSADTTLVKGAATDLEGVFSFQTTASGPHRLAFSMVGYQPLTQPLTLLDASVDLPPTVLKPADKVLGEVKVVAKKPLIEMQGDKIVFNVESSPVAGGLNAFELLEKVPGVTVSKTEQTLSLQGRTGVLVMIDNRPTYLSPDQLANLLKTMRAEEIETIEVISNPSSRYDAAGGNGILNIRTKRAKLFGTQYTYVLGGGYSYYPQYGSYPKYHSSLSVSHRRERLTLYGGLSFNRHRWITAARSLVRLLEGRQTIETRTEDEFAEGYGYHANIRAGIDYSPTKKTSLGAQLKGTRGRDEFDRTLEQRIQGAAGNERIGTVRYRDANSWNLTANANLRHILDTTGSGGRPHELTADLDFVRVKDTYFSRFDNRFFPETDQPVPTRTLNRIDRPTYTRIVSVKTDYIKPLPGGVRLEAGVKVSFVKNDVTFSSDFVPNQPTAVFNYAETIYAAYLSAQGPISKKVQYQAGLRAEQTDLTGKDGKGEAMVTYRYLNLFPSANLTYKAHDKHQFALSYSRRIDRPTYDRFNPFRQFFSRLEYMEGNPQLLPGFRNSASLTYSFNSALSFSFSYQGLRRFHFGVYDVDEQLIPGERLIRSSYENVPDGKLEWMGLNSSVQLSLRKWWNLSGNLWWGVGQTRLVRKQTIIDTRQPQGGAYLSHTITLSAALSLEISGWFNSASLNGFQTGRSQGSVNFGLMQSLWNKKANMKLSLDDPFNLARYRYTASTAEYQSENTSRWDNRQVRLTFTYNFGNLNVKSAAERRPAEELNRVGGKDN